MAIRRATGLIIVATIALAVCGSAAAQRIGEELLSIEFIEPPEQILPGDRNGVAALTDAAPRIDGVLDDPAWAAGTVYEGFFDPITGRQADPMTRARFAHNIDMVFFAIECLDPGADIASAEYGARNRVELLFDTPHDEISYKGLIIYADGRREVIAGGGGDPNWQPRAEAAVARLGDRWIVEVAIPRSVFMDTANAIWGFNIVRRSEGADGEIVRAWNPTLDDPVDPPNFGHLYFQLLPVYIRAANLGRFHAGRTNMRVAVENTSARSIDLRAVIALGDIEGAMQRTPYRIEIAPREAVWLEFDVSISRDRDKCDVVFVLMRPDMETVITGFIRRGMPVPALLGMDGDAAPGDDGIVNARFNISATPEELRATRLTFYLRGAAGTLAHIVRRAPNSGEGRIKIDAGRLEAGEYSLMVIAEIPRKGTLSARIAFNVGAEE